MKYEFVEVEYENSPAGSSKGGKHREIINDYAKKGYKYVGFVPTKIGPSGKVLEIDLIFSIEK